jgi:hypothetical protein
MSRRLGFFNKFSKQTLLGSSFDSLKSLNGYSPHQGIRLPFFNLLLMMAIYGAQDRVKDEAYLHHMYCKVENRIQGENQIIQSDQDVHV